MEAAKDCPKCRLVNPPHAQRCDCGYDFVSRTVQASYLEAGRGPQPDAGGRVVGYGCLALAPLLLAGGVLGSLRPAPPGGDEAFMLGRLLGTLLPAVLALAVGGYLVRRGRS